MEIIDGLLRIKRIRENSREAQMRLARQQLQLAAEAMRRATEAQQQRDRERQQREKSLYEDVCTRLVIVRELDDLRWQVDVMKEAAKVDAKAVVDAQEARVARRTAFEEATGVWRLAAHATQKFQDLSNEQSMERTRHAEFLAELELEEHPSRSMMAEAIQEEEEA
ncbi:MAG: YscO family type III secretion system apparatus protein [Polaromonas sp.]|nr:YscO family type III secretion system apparatus protein [Polaromonas sp.]